MSNKLIFSENHRFLDEAGDTTFFGKGGLPILNTKGVSKTFIIGMTKFKERLLPLREQIINFQKEIELDSYFKDVPSIQKKINKRGFFFHAKDDIPEIREKFYKFIKNIDCSFEAVVARKILGLYIINIMANKLNFMLIYYLIF